MEDLKFLIEKLERELDKFENKAEIDDIGRVVKSGDGIVWIDGLEKAYVNEILIVKDKNIPLLTLNLEEGLIGSIALSDFEKISEGDIVLKTESVVKIPVGEKLLGRVINPLGNPLDSLGEIEAVDFYPLEREAPSVIEREPVDTPLHTGIKIIDALIPIGRGQRELILGDRQTGKTSIAIDTIINQKKDPLETPVCIYVAIGQKKSKVRQIYETLKEAGALDYTIIIATFSSDLPGLIYLAPYAGCSIGEYFMEQGKDAVVIYDDLTKHAWAWREINLLLKRPAGREAYPGDIFYLHSRLLERAAKIKGGGSLTALPICETQLGDISAYIPTNLISITDGQIYLETDLFNVGFRPAINIGLSVSRVGSKAQTKAMKKIAGGLKLSLAQYRELEAFSQVAAELSEETKQKLLRGKVLLEILKQDNFKPLSFEKIVILLYFANLGYFDDLTVDEIRQQADNILGKIEVLYPDLLNKIREKKDVDEEIEEFLKNVLVSVKNN